MSVVAIIERGAVGAGVVLGGLLALLAVLFCACWLWDRDWFRFAVSWAALLSAAAAAGCVIAGWFIQIGTAVLG